jgi:hypothetical protein
MGAKGTYTIFIYGDFFLMCSLCSTIYSNNAKVVHYFFLFGNCITCTIFYWISLFKANNIYLTTELFTSNEKPGKDKWPKPLYVKQRTCSYYTWKAEYSVLSRVGNLLLLCASSHLSFLKNLGIGCQVKFSCLLLISFWLFQHSNNILLPWFNKI